jgi:hypothetical protein
VDVAAEHRLDPWVARHDLAHGLAPRAAHAVEERNAGGEGRVVHADQRGALRRLGQPRLEPGQTRGAELAAFPPRDVGVEGNDPERIVFEHVMQELPLPRQVARIAEGGPQVGTVVVVARDHVDRHGEASQRRLDLGVVLGAFIPGQIAGHQHDVRRRGQAVQVRNGPLQAAPRVDHRSLDLDRPAHVQIGDLGDDHSSPPDWRRNVQPSAPVRACARWTPPSGNPRAASVQVKSL